jgi:hypothetical protein
MNKIYLFIVLSLFCNGFITGQSEQKENVYAEEDQYEDDPYYWSYSKEIGINFTPLISKLVPFNLGQNEAGKIGLIWKKYYSKRAFRISLGANITEDFQDIDTDFFYLAVGLERRYPITKDKKIAYTSAWDIFLQADENGDGPAVGLAKGYGFEYHFTKRIFISTEAQFKIGLGGEFGGPVIEFQLPLAIFVNVRLY